ncbi:unnamed protein product [Polarella glacialis]|uniref:Uncharacterized protein n=1 Tax=Polarella glacialis TaxID=89957 RepID=A0A813GTD1_POLGL|nr:unnamed protein product [Polarella glacialis]
MATNVARPNVHDYYSCLDWVQTLHSEAAHQDALATVRSMIQSAVLEVKQTDGQVKTTESETKVHTSEKSQKNNNNNNNDNNDNNDSNDNNNTKHAARKKEQEAANQTTRDTQSNTNKTQL